MKYLHYIYRNARRNPVRSLLTIASTAVTLFLMMILVSFFTINGEVAKGLGEYNRIVAMNSQGFAGQVPISRVREIAANEGVIAATPFSWYGGKYGEEQMPFAQFGVDPDTIFQIYDELTIPADQLKAFREDKAGCVIGSKLAEDRGWKVGDPLPLKGDIYQFDLDLTIRGIYDGPHDRDRRMCMFHWSYLDEGLKRISKGEGAGSGNAGVIVAKCSNSAQLASLCRKIDADYVNSDKPSRTQTEEAFGAMFSEMMRDLQWLIAAIGMAVLVSLIFVAGNAMAMALRERTTEVAILKAIGFNRSLVLNLVLAEAVLVAGIGGLLGSFGCKILCDVVDISRYSAGTLPFFFVSWKTALSGLLVSLLIGLLSGIIPAVTAARRSVIQGLRKVV
ncbi:putative ABC transport system permease protein [Singulisphaera sp. GP187]|uniref:ABC transporter permease n=1 Tax=Singulisphaera sp. GP187 TaxID=1882752 RepID=UPI00092B26FD|nr:FtsX-like permease family protein [Singulisphaera sp. GP187]SIO64782.1 putative ABC transport system permease protein [Singulisphaera sp. GP187]